MSTSCPTTANHSKISLQIEDMILPTSTGTYNGIVLESATLTPSTTDYNYFDAETGACQRTIQISKSQELASKMLLRSSNPSVLQALLRALEGEGKRFMLHPGNNTLTPSAGDPLIGGYLSVKPFGTIGGEVGTVWNVEATHMVDGAIEELEAVPAAPTTLASPAQTDTTVDLTWDADAGFLTNWDTKLTIRGYNVYRSETSGGSVTDPYVRCNATEVVNPGEGVVSFTDDGTGPAGALTASTTYYYIVRGIWQFGLESLDSAELLQATTV